MNEKLIYGIQQIGVGVENADEAFEWYGTRLGADVSVFDDKKEATHMAQYMGGKSHRKRAILAMNMQGGSGYEIWQYLDRIPKKLDDPMALGDTGINITIVKSNDIQKSFDRLKELGVQVLSGISTELDGKKCFHIMDPYENILRVKEFDSWYADRGEDIGGIFGCVLGVSNIDESRRLYTDILGYDEVIYDHTGTFDDLDGLPNGNSRFRRILLGHNEKRTGGFSNLLGESQLELIQSLDSEPKKLFENRFWGDIGFIHLCFDIRNMKALVEECKKKGFPFKVLSEESFDMGDANGHWGYLEDSDGTLIEFVETHKVPLVKKINWNINLRNRDPRKPLPNWLVKALSLNRVKFKPAQRNGV